MVYNEKKNKKEKKQGEKKANHFKPFHNTKCFYKKNKCLMSSPRQNSEPQGLTHRDSSSASSLHQIISQPLWWQTRKFSPPSAPKLEQEMAAAFLQLTFCSFRPDKSIQVPLSTPEMCVLTQVRTGEQISPTFLRNRNISVSGKSVIVKCYFKEIAKELILGVFHCNEETRLLTAKHTQKRIWSELQIYQ